MIWQVELEEEAPLAGNSTGDHRLWKMNKVRRAIRTMIAEEEGGGVCGCLSDLDERKKELCRCIWSVEMCFSFAST